MLKRQKPKMSLESRRLLKGFLAVFFSALLTLGLYYSTRDFVANRYLGFQKNFWRAGELTKLRILPKDLRTDIRDSARHLTQELLGKKINWSSNDLLFQISKKIKTSHPPIFSVVTTRMQDQHLQIKIEMATAQIALVEGMNTLCYDAVRKYMFGDCRNREDLPLFLGFTKTAPSAQSNTEIEKAFELFLLSQRRFGTIKSVTHEEDRGFLLELGSQPIYALIGYEAFPSRLDRLSKVVSGLTEDEKLSALWIELDFSDKAFVKRLNAKQKEANFEKIINAKG